MLHLPILTRIQKSNTQKIKIALQVGHWKTEQSPAELADLRKSFGATSGTIHEWQINYAIARKTADILKSNGFAVDILPTMIPTQYQADIFIAIHADQNADSHLSGFKAAGAANDKTGKASILANVLETEYVITTGMSKDSHITRNMTDYYAFNHQKFKHAINDRTIGVIVENGFLTNPVDQHMLLNYPEIPARGLANGIIRYANYNM